MLDFACKPTELPHERTIKKASESVLGRWRTTLAVGTVNSFGPLALGLVPAKQVDELQNYGDRARRADCIDKTCIFDKFRRYNSQNLQISQVFAMG